jgi:hypothetical protein
MARMIPVFAILFACGVFEYGCGCENDIPCILAERPDLLEERAGDQGRFYIPGDSPPESYYEWKDSTTTGYFLERGVKKVYAGGDTGVLPMTDEERARVENLIRIIREKQGPPLKEN